MAQKIYLLEHLGCANCAAKIEREIAALPGIQSATITFATRQLLVAAEDPDSYLSEMQRIANSHEPDIVITERKRKTHQHDSAPHRLEHEERKRDGSGYSQEGHHHHEEHHHGSEHSNETHHHHESCGCEHSHESHSIPHETSPHRPLSASAVRKVYTIENLDCANCAAAVERKIAAMPEVQEVTLTFATKQLRITAEDPDGILDQVRAVAASVEPGVEIFPRTRNGERSRGQADSFSGQAQAPTVSPVSDAPKSISPEASSRTGKKPSLVTSENRRDFLAILAGAVLFAAGICLSLASFSIPAGIALLAAYVILGGEVVITAVKNLFHGNIFDENFLMSLATIAAICIGDFKEAVGVMLFYRIGELFEEIAVERSRSQIMEAVDLRPEVVTKVHGDHSHVIPAEDAKIGDLLLIRPGDRIPLDGTVVDGESRIDTSPVTGEPIPVNVRPMSSVISGCINTSGVLKIRVEKTLDESMVTKILDSVENAAASKPQIERFITRFARVYTPFVVVLALLTAILPSLFTGNWNYWIYTAVTFLVISCPCALVLSVPLAFFSGIGAGSKRCILFKGGISLEAMKNVRAVVMDKTGTITEGNFLLQKVLPEPGTDEGTLLSLASSAEQNSTHPIAQSILAASRERGLSIEPPASVEEIPGHGIRAELTLGEFLVGNRKLMNRFGVPMHSVDPQYGTEVFVALNGSFLGTLVIADTIKEEAASAISSLRSQGIVTAMLTGDADSNAKAVAEATGIDEVHARLLPQDKLARLQSIRAAHGSVMFVGDGINDAPVLAGADVGAAMGSGADAAIEAADVVFMTSRLDAVPKSLSIARQACRIARQNVVFALVIKALVLLLGLFGFANMWMAVFADTGVAMICVLNSIRVLYQKP